MNLKKHLSVLFLLILTSLLFSQQSFEGKVVFQVEDGNDQQVLNYFVKGKKFRMEMPGGEGAMVYDVQAGKMLVLMSEQKMYMEMPVDLPKETLNEIEEAEGSFKRTGETKEILGYTCEKFLFDSGENRGEAWMTKELGGFMLFDDPQNMKGSGNNWKSEILAAGYFPLLVHELDNSGKIQNTFKVLEIEPGTLDAGLFSPPAGFQRFEMPNLNLDNYK
jgi:hypothetical protein